MGYLLHFFDQHEHVRRSIRLDAATDEEAVRRAAEIDHPYVMEVWTADRCVRRFEPPGQALVA